MKQYGCFKNKSYIVTDRNTPRHWYNYLYNEEYVTFVSQVGFGQGIAQDGKGVRVVVIKTRGKIATVFPDSIQPTRRNRK